jgi:hypothetical protein
MGSRGRDSAASLETVALTMSRSAQSCELIAIGRPPPPDDLTDEQAEEWIAIVNRLPADHFPRETHGFLVEYCRHIAMARKIGLLLTEAEKAKTFDLTAYDQLARMSERTGRYLAHLGTKMRITQHSLYDAKKKRGSIAQRPWDNPR